MSIVPETIIGSAEDYAGLQAPDGRDKIQELSNIGRLLRDIQCAAEEMEDCLNRDE